MTDAIVGANPSVSAVDLEDCDSLRYVPPEAMREHNAACARGDSMYKDPASGLYVMTEKYLRDRKGGCCGNKCRHCPFNHVNVKPAKPRQRAESKLTLTAADYSTAAD